jgi:hypothetical protein
MYKKLKSNTAKKIIRELLMSANLLKKVEKVWLFYIRH